jgi:hypothetical protein
MKPETYKGDDAVKITCKRTYKVDDGTDNPVTFEAGKDYTVSPRSAVHLLRKSYAVHGETKDGKRGKYLGDAPFFADAKADAEQAEADKAEKAAKAKKATGAKKTAADTKDETKDETKAAE